MTSGLWTGAARRIVAIGACIALISTPAGRAAAQGPGAAGPAAGARPPATERRSVVVVPRVDGRVVVDGRLDEPLWSGSARLSGFVQVRPGDNTRPSYPTEVLVAYGPRHLYVGIRAADDPRAVRATLARRDDVLRDDNVELVLDTFDDARHAYVLAFNPLGIQQDGVLSEGDSVDYSVDLVMTSRGVITDSGYTIEVAIPFGSLRYAPSPPRTWGLHVRRRIRHLDEESSWMPLVRGRSGFLDQAGRLAGLDEIADQRPVEIIGSLTSTRRMQSVPLAAGAFATERTSRVDPGLSAKGALAAGTVLELAVNPDFAQVEADTVVVRSNTRFPILYEEKRPFFLEGIELFQTPIRTIHTRTIVDPDAALKASGKRGATAFAAIVASDAAPGTFTAAERGDTALRAEIGPLVGRHATMGVVRVRRDLGGRSSLGALGAGYRFVDRSNYVAGVDGRLTMGERDVATFQLVGTTTRRVRFDSAGARAALPRTDGVGYHGQYRHTARHLSWTATAEGLTPDYEAALGFTRQTDIGTWRLDTRYDAEPRPDSPLISWSLTHTGLLQNDWQGRMKYAYVYPGVELHFRRQAYVNLSAYADYLKLLEEEFGPPGTFAAAPERSGVYRGVTLQTGITPSERYAATLLVDRTWNAFDYDFGAAPRFSRASPAALADPDAPLDPGHGTSLDVIATFRWQPNDAVRASLGYTHSRLFRTDTRRLAYEERLYTVQATRQFGPFVAVRARGDYAWLTSNLRGQLLASWTPSPGTAFYLGYDDDLTQRGIGPQRAAGERGLRRNGRSVFAKLSYALRGAL